MGMLDLRELRHLLALFQLHVGFLPFGAIARELAAPAQFAIEGSGTNFRHFHLKKLLHGGLHLRLIGAQRDFEAQGPLVVLLVHALLGDERAMNYFKDCHFASASENFRAAASEMRTFWWPSRW